MIGKSELQFRKAFWEAVEKCLSEFHGKSAAEARTLISKFKKSFPINSTDPTVDLLYHLEPFGLACEVAGTQLDIKEFAAKYREIVSSAFDNKNVVSIETKRFAERKRRTHKEEPMRIALFNRAKPAAKTAVRAAKKAKPATKRSVAAAKKAKPATKRSVAAAKKAKPATTRSVAAAKKAKPAAKTPVRATKKAKPAARKAVRAAKKATYKKRIF